MTKYINFAVGQEYTTLGAENYLIWGIEPGGFLKAVICNDLYRASATADYQNKPILTEISAAVFHNFPHGSYGGYEQYENWMRNKDGIRTEFSRYMEKQFTFNSLKGKVKDDKNYIPF